MSNIRVYEGILGRIVRDSGKRWRCGYHFREIIDEAVVELKVRETTMCVKSAA